MRSLKIWLLVMNCPKYFKTKVYCTVSSWSSQLHNDNFSPNKLQWTSHPVWCATLPSLPFPDPALKSDVLLLKSMFLLYFTATPWVFQHSGTTDATQGQCVLWGPMDTMSVCAYLAVGTGWSYCFGCWKNGGRRTYWSYLLSLDEMIFFALLL